MLPDLIPRGPAALQTPPVPQSSPRMACRVSGTGGPREELGVQLHADRADTTPALRVVCTPTGLRRHPAHRSRMPARRPVPVYRSGTGPASPKAV